MWIFDADLGFFSLVLDQQRPGNLLVRCRDRADALRLAAFLGLPESAVILRDDADYRYRLSVGRKALAKLFAEQVRHIDYPNFKARVSKIAGHERAEVYARVWSVLLELQSRSKALEPRR